MDSTSQNTETENNPNPNLIPTLTLAPNLNPNSK